MEIGVDCILAECQRKIVAWDDNRFMGAYSDSYKSLPLISIINVVPPRALSDLLGNFQTIQMA